MLPRSSPLAAARAISSSTDLLSRDLTISMIGLLSQLFSVPLSLDRS